MGVIQTNVSLLYQLVGKPETYSLYLSIQQMFGVMFNRLWDLRLNNGSWNHAELFFKFHHCKTISYCVYHIRGEINSWCIIILVCQYTLFAITEGGSGCMSRILRTWQNWKCSNGSTSRHLYHRIVWTAFWTFHCIMWFEHYQ